MNEALLSACITGAAAIIGNVIISNRNAREMNFKLEKHQAVTDTKLEELTREVREHNNFARRMPVVEQQIGEANRRINELSAFHRPN